jgi:hypothetical protein
MILGKISLEPLKPRGSLVRLGYPKKPGALILVCDSQKPSREAAKGWAEYAQTTQKTLKGLAHGSLLFWLQMADLFSLKCLNHVVNGNHPIPLSIVLFGPFLRP